MKISLLSILVPVYNERECLPLLYEKLCEVTAALPCATEILFVNDGSTDDTLERIKTLQQSDYRIVYVDLSRNYGKETAVSAGIDHIRGDALVILDADLQDPPDLMFSAKAIDALRQIKESERNMKGLFSYIGFRKKCITYEQPPRAAGSTKWSFLKLLDLAIKGWTSFSVLPLRIISFTGVTVSVAALFYLLIVLLKALVLGDPVGGYPSMMCVILFLGGFVLLALGIIGEYLGIIYQETKKRPYYFVNKVLRIES
ncbi:hypothetical protein FACS1894207_0920 [Bacteroidia bacterium]|nr:hypothetical protein FACS1894207_0920 [Bacteroidia bacterium]